MTLVLTSVLLACVLHVSYACMCLPVTFEDAFCQGPNKGRYFLIQAEVTGVTGPLYPEYMSPDMQESYAYKRYELAVKEIYRDATGLVKPVTFLQADINSELCGIELKLGKTYVFSGTAFVNSAGEEELSTYLCEYNRQYGTTVDMAIPDCEKYQDVAEDERTAKI